MPAPAIRRVMRPARPSPLFVQNRKAKPSIGEILCRNELLTPGQLTRANAIQITGEAQLSDVLIAQGMATERDVASALAEKWSRALVDLNINPPDLAFAQSLPADICLEHCILPYRNNIGGMSIATSDPASFHTILRALPARFRRAEPVVATRTAISREIARVHKPSLSDLADTRCPERLSCRNWAKPIGRPLIFAAIMMLVATAFVYPQMTVWVVFCCAMVNLLATSFLRVTALQLHIRNAINARRNIAIKPSSIPKAGKLPIVSVLVPLHREEAILPNLIRRLARSEYPKELLDICFVVEASDMHTRAAFDAIKLPHWMRVIEVPEARLKTKPRAMNYALGFCRGSIIGIYDAEDAPEPDQIHRLVAHFAKSGPEVACIQGYLDFYNAKENWLSRCFTIEYAIWFRVILHGMEKLGLPMPLGGTTVFFRREALEKLGAWDAYNVTEDADLGMRLARFGYSCAFVPTITHEEANCHPLPWIKQRSRWLKGYAMTWITHMQEPRKLWRDLGPKGFFTFQIILLGTLSTFLLAPAIWSFWLIAFGLSAGFIELLPALARQVLGTAFVISEIILALVGFLATSGKSHRFLIPWVPTMIAYWPLGTIAAYKAIYELLLAPFYWDKTSHGHSADNCPQPDTAANGAKLT